MCSNFQVIKTVSVDTKVALLPFYRLYTPYSLHSKAEFFEPYSSSRTALTMNSGSRSHGRLFKLPLIAKGVFNSNTADITVKITVGLDNSVRETSDSDPKFMLSHGKDGYYGIGFEMRDENVRCQGIKGVMGSTLTSKTTYGGANHISEPLPEQFTMIFNPSERWGSCYHSVDSGVISPVYYSNYPYLTEGLYLEVYRESATERYSFQYIIVEIYGNS